MSLFNSSLRFRGSKNTPFTQILNIILPNNSTPFDFTREKPKKNRKSHGSGVFVNVKKHRTICYSHDSNRWMENIF